MSNVNIQNTNYLRPIETLWYGNVRYPVLPQSKNKNLNLFLLLFMYLTHQKSIKT